MGAETRCSGCTSLDYVEVIERFVCTNTIALGRAKRGRLRVARPIGTTDRTPSWCPWLRENDAS
jgi:hypothetical protein